MYNCREILRLTKRLSETAAPDEDYWSRYNARLREKLSHATAQRRSEITGASVAPLRRCVRILLLPIPVPLAVAVIIGLVFGLFAVRSIRQPPTLAPAIMQVPVEVPVVQEKIVAKVVYRDRYLLSKPSKRPRRDSQVDSAIARSQKPRTDDIPTLTGFKPTEDVKLTVIKGGFPDEK